MSPDDFMREYEAAAASHDLERTLPLIAPDAVFWFSNGTSHVGRAAIEAAFRANFETIEAEIYRIVDLEWRTRSEDSAACTYRFEWSGKIQGAPASGSGRGTSVLTRHGSSWLIVHEHLSQARQA